MKIFSFTFYSNIHFLSFFHSLSLSLSLYSIEKWTILLNKTPTNQPTKHTHKPLLFIWFYIIWICISVQLTVNNRIWVKRKKFKLCRDSISLTLFRFWYKRILVWSIHSFNDDVTNNNKCYDWLNHNNQWIWSYQFQIDWKFFFFIIFQQLLFTRL